MRVSLAAWLDPQFWRWAAWFWLNSLMPGWADFNHQSHRCIFASTRNNSISIDLLAVRFKPVSCPLHLPRLLALYSLQCQEEEERRLGDRISCGKTAVETLRLFTCQTEMDAFLKSEQAQFWAEAGFPFSPLTADECRYLMLLGNCIGHDNYGVSLCENGFSSSL